MIEPVNDNILNLVNELYNNLDAKDKIINEQVLEIARLKKDLKDACYVIEKIKKEKQQAIKYIDIETEGCDEEPIEGRRLKKKLEKLQIEKIKCVRVLCDDEYCKEILGDNNGK